MGRAFLLPVAFVVVAARPRWLDAGAEAALPPETLPRPVPCAAARDLFDFVWLPAAAAGAALLRRAEDGFGAAFEGVAFVAPAWLVAALPAATLPAADLSASALETLVDAAGAVFAPPAFPFCPLR